MNNFKVGDRVKRLNYSQGNFEVGQVGVIKALEHGNKRVVLEGDKPGFCHDPANLALVEARSFKAGDKVRRVSGLHNGMTAGRIDTVVAYVGTASLKLAEFGTGHDASKFVLVEAAPAPVGPFKAGDTVCRRAGNGKNCNKKEGEAFKVERTSGDGRWVYDEQGGAHLAEYLEMAPAVVEHKFKVGQLVRRIAKPMGRGNYKLGSEFRVVRLDSDGDVYDDADDIHEQSNIELVLAAAAPVDPFGIEVVTTTTVKGGRIETAATCAEVLWKDSDEASAILVTIDGMFMKAADLRQAADLFKALADKLEGLTK